MAELNDKLHEFHEIWNAFSEAAKPAVAHFQACHAEPREKQLQVLNQILDAAKDSAFAHVHDFSTIHSYEDFKQRVPISTWAETQSWVDKSCASSELVLSGEKPLFFEPTSGSNANRKLIPYTPRLLSEFQSAIIVWLASLYKACPEIADGRGYWSLSPQAQVNEQTANGIPIGCGNDMGYLLNSIVVPLLQSVLNPPGLNESPEHWRVNSLAAMINAEDLTMISVWSPTFLLALLEPMMRSESTKDTNTIKTLRENINASRLALFDEACTCGDYSKLWPKLVVLSTWTAGPSESFAKRLSNYFPNVKIIPKGLLATEGVVSISYGVSEYCPLALSSHFLEFLTDDGSVVLADELQAGERYQPLLTTGGGLYRYKLGDIVEVDPSNNTGLLSIKFVERADSRCDLVGEKLDENLAQQACSDIIDSGIGCALVPNADSQPACYVLVVDEVDGARVIELVNAAELALQNVHHYANARKLGQLGPLVPSRVENVSALLQNAWEATDKLAGDYKPSVLVSSLPLAQVILKHCDANTENLQ